MIRRARTLAIARFLSALGPLPKRRARIPRQQPPHAIQLAYFNALSPVVDAARAAVATVEHEIVAELVALRERQGRTDSSGFNIGTGRASQLGKKAAEKERRSQLAAAGWVGRELESATVEGQAARAQIDRAAKRFASSFRPHELHAVARRFGERTDEHQRGQLDAQVRAAMGISLAQIERPTTDRIEGWAAENVELIVTVPTRYFDRLRLDVEDAYGSGMHPETLAQQFADRYDMALDDSRRIARDQISKLNAQVNQDRQESLGVTGYTWRTMRDNRVRDEHFDLEGQHFEWDNPPAEGHPGDAVLCRCYAEPDLAAVVDALRAA